MNCNMQATSMDAAVTVTRIFAASRERVFRAWTDAAQLKEWWGPHGFTNPVCEVDAREGGTLHIVMRAPDGTDYPMTGEFHEIVAPQRLVFSSVARDAGGKALLEGTTTVTFAEHDSGTLVTVVAAAHGLTETAPAMLAGMQAGWTQSLERLDALSGKS